MTIALILGLIAVGLLVLLLTWLRICVVIVKQGTKKVVERFGVYRRTLSEGFHLILKPFDRIALNPWSAIPEETVALLTRWDRGNDPQGLLSEEEVELMERRITELTDNINAATDEDDKRYWIDVLKAERDYWDEKIETRLEQKTGLDQYVDASDISAVVGTEASDVEPYPSTDMDRREIRWTVASGDVNKKRRVKSAVPTGRYRMSPAGYTKSLDVHEILDYIDMRECFIDLGENPVITLDNASIGVETCFFYQVTDVFSYYYGVDKPLEAIKKLTVTTLRNLIGSMTLEQTLISRQEVNARLREALDEATGSWGIKINRVEIEELKLADDMKQAMNEVLIADRRRRVKIIEAEADATYYLKLKEAEAEGYRRIKEVDIDETVLKIKGYEAVKHLAEGQATKIFVPGSLNNVVTNSHIFADALGEAIKDDGKKADEQSSPESNPVAQPQMSEAGLNAIAQVEESVVGVSGESSEEVSEVAVAEDNK